MGATLRLLLVLLTVAARSVAAAVPPEVASGLASAVAQGDLKAGLTQAELIVSGQLNGDFRAARGTLEQAARNGDGDAAYALGVLAYQNAPSDLTSARRWWRIAAQAGHKEAQYNLGLLLAGNDSYTPEADAAFKAAAAQQHVLACFALGTRLADGDEVGARRWLQCAAEQGYGPAQFNLATLLVRAAKNDEDLAAARRWFAAAAPIFAPAASALAALSAQQDNLNTVALQATPLSLRDEAWVMAQPGSAYTVQVASGTSTEVLIALLRRQLGAVEAACVRERPASRQPFSAIVGTYPDRVSATRAMADLPASLRANQPWVRRFSTLQQALREAAMSTQQAADDAQAVSN